MNGLEEAIIEKFHRDGKTIVWMGHDDVSKISPRRQNYCLDGT